MSFRTKIANTSATVTRFILKNILRRQAGFFPGQIALKIDQDLLSHYSSLFDAGTVLVTGTNGKTSVTALIANCMKSAGYYVSWNEGGANLESGVVNSVMFFDKGNSKNFGVYEVDELWVKKVLPKLQSKYLLLLNLFPDQVDRFGGIDKIQESLIKALKSSSKTTLIYNADDPNCQYVADNCDNTSVSFGFNEKISVQDEDCSNNNCPACGEDLSYSLHQYAQLGIYKCPKCGFNRANTDFEFNNIKLTADQLKFKFKKTDIASKKAAEYACYNYLGFCTCAKLLGCSYTSIKQAIANQKNDNGRLQAFDLGKSRVYINLAKNPVGFNQNIKLVLNNIDASDVSKNYSVAFFVNAREGDGFSTDWLADVNFDKLSGITNLKIYYGGEADNALLKQLDNKNLYAKHVANANELLKNTDGDSLAFIIANYTAMFPLREELIKLSK